MEMLSKAFERIEHNLTVGIEPRLEPHPREPSAGELLDRYERAAARAARLAKVTGILAAVALLAYIGYRIYVYQTKEPGDYLRDARQAESQGPSQAIAAYEALIGRFPDSSEAVTARQRINEIRRRLDQERRRATFRAKDNSDALRAQTAYAHFKRAEEVAAKGNLEHAIRIFRMVRDIYFDTQWGPRADARLQAAEEELKARKTKHPSPEP
jgi:outer membrane protein assembly factor BamD (BamD/ComL family)